MSQEKEFYPLVSHTIKVLMELCPDEYAPLFLQTIKIYPKVLESLREDALMAQVLKELDRQYARWKGGNK